MSALPRRMGAPRLARFTMADHDEMTGTTAWDDWAATEVARRVLAGLNTTVIGFAPPAMQFGRPPDDPGAAAAAMRIARARDEVTRQRWSR